MLRFRDTREPRSHYHEEREFSKQTDPNLLYGVVGTTREDRLAFPAKSYTKELRIARQIQKKYTFKLLSVEDKEETFEVKLFNLSQVYESLAEINSEYPNISGVGIHLRGYKFIEGPGMKKRIRDFIFTINKLRLDTFWKILLIEPIIKKMNNQRYQTEEWSEIHLMLKLVGNPIILDSYLEERYPDKSSKNLFLKRGATFIANHIRISLIESIQRIRIPNRKKGHSDKVTSKRVRKPKTKEVYSFERTLYNFPEYIDEGGYYMEPEKKLEENLYNIMVKSTERYLEWLKQQPKEIQEQEAQKSQIIIENEKKES